MSYMNDRDDVFQISRFWDPRTFGDRCFYYDVFVSHSNGDESAEFVKGLRDHGLRVWYDEYQVMDDALWSARIEWGLQVACSIICFVGSKSLERHAWVRAEIDAGRLPGASAGVARVFVVHAGTKQDVPSWLAGDPIGLRYEFGALSENAVQEFAAFLRSLNRVTIDTVTPPFEALMQRAQVVSATLEEHPLDPNRWYAMTRLEELQMWTALALNVVAATKTVELVDKSVVFELLYNLRLASDPLWPPPDQPESGADGVDARYLANDLGLLASLPNLNADTRGIMYLVLERIAGAGVTYAFHVLRGCLRWEWSSTLVEMIADTLARYPAHCGRNEAVLTILKGDPSGVSWPLDLLDEDDRVVRLKHYVRRLTALKISALAPLKRFHELTEQMKQAIRDLTTTGVEMVFRSAIPSSGVSWARYMYFKLDPNAPSDASTILPKLVMQCAAEWPEQYHSMLWLLPFEDCIFGPLHALHFEYGAECGAADAMTRFVDALEEPISKDDDLLADLPESVQAHHLVRLALQELRVRRATIRALREPAKITEENDMLDIEIYELSSLERELRELRDLRWLAMGVPSLFSVAAPSKEGQMALEIAQRVVDTWKDMPFC